MIRALGVGIVAASLTAFWHAPDGNAPAPAPAPGQTGCLPGQIVPRLNAYPYQWKAGSHVSVWMDRDGRAARGDHRNSRPKFTLGDGEAQAIFSGIDEWGGIPEAGVTFGLVAANPGRLANYWVSVTWPVGDITFIASDGNTKRLTCQVPPASVTAAAYSCSYEDQINEVSQSHTIAATLTMLNTHHTYVSPWDGRSHETWGYRDAGWLSALWKVGAHENGHAMGLADVPALYPDGLPTRHVMKPFNGTNDAAPLGGLPRVGPVTSCDRATILAHSSRQYERWVCAGPGAVAPPPCESDERPVCANPDAIFPAPTWTCQADDR
jgi:hypothetical protein